MGQLQLAFLGTPVVRHAGDVISFPTRKALALLVYLVVQGGVHAREKLAAIFWPEHDTSGGRTNLRTTLALLRSTLRHDRDDDPSHLLAERNSLAFNGDAGFDLDLDVLASAVAIADATDVARDERIGRLQAAARTYRGDFLDGFSLGDAFEFDDWAGIQREKWHRQAEVVFDRLSQLQAEAGEIRQAIATVNRWLEVAPLSETPYRRLMRLHFTTGERDVALRAYESCCKMLAKQLGVSPAPETEAVAERIRSETPPRRTQRSEPEHAVHGELPIIGREEEHATLVEAYYTMRRGDEQVILLEGEAGIGKTRLAHEFLAWAHAHDAYVVRGRAIETGGRLPYQPLVKVLRLVLDTTNILVSKNDGTNRGQGEGGTRSDASGLSSPSLRVSLSPMWLAELSRLLPELHDRYPDLPTPSSGDAARTRLFEAVVRLGIALAAQTPLVLFIDDLQWADTGSLDLLQYAIGRWYETDTPILLLLSIRSEALLGPVDPHADATRLREWLAGLEREVPLTRLTLSALSEDETLELVTALSNVETFERSNVSTRQTFAEWLHVETDGHPFYISETLETLFERDLLRLRRAESGERVLDLAGLVDEDGWLDETLRQLLPPGVHRVIRTRLDRLPRDAFDLLAAGAVLGATFSFETLTQVAGLQPGDALAALDDLLAHRLVVETGERDHPYSFVHDKIRDVVYTEAGDARRRLFHRRAFETLRSEGAASAELAHHALGAGLAEAAVRHSIAAGETAMELFAVHDAIVHYRRARRIMQEQSEVDVAFGQRKHLYMRLGRAYEIAGELERAAGVFEVLRDEARAAGKPAVESLALNRLAFIRAQQHDFEAASALIGEGLSLAERTGDTRALAESHWNVAQLGLYGGNVAGMQAHGERALGLARDLDDDELIARCLNVLAYTERNHGRAEPAIAYAEEARRINAERGNLALEADCLGVLTQAQVMAGRPKAAVGDARTALQISREIESSYGVFFGSLVLTFALVECGEYGEALVLAEDLVARTCARDEQPRTAMVLIALSVVQRALCAFKDACATDAEALRLSEAGDMSIPLASVAAMNLCADYALLGEWNTAYDYARQAIDIENGVWLFLAGTIPWRLKVRTLLHAGDRVEAQAVVERLEACVDDYRRLRVPCRRSRAALAQYDGDLDRAVSDLEEALALAEEIGLPGERWQILADIGDIYHEQGDDERAHDAHVRAAETVRDLAAGITDEALRAAFLEATPALQQTR